MRSRLDEAMLQYSFVDAFDARSLTSLPTGTLTSATLYSAWVSHVRAMRAFAESGESCALILEDDAVLETSLDWVLFLKDLEQLMSSEALDYVQLGHISAAYPKGNWLMRTARRYRNQPPTIRPRLAGRSFVLQLGLSRAGAHAYVLSRSLAEAIPQYNDPTWVGPDGFFERFASACQSEGQFRLATTLPSLVEQESREFVGSTIDSDNFPTA